MEKKRKVVEVDVKVNILRKNIECIEYKMKVKKSEDSQKKYRFHRERAERALEKLLGRAQMPYAYEPTK